MQTTLNGRSRRGRRRLAAACAALPLVSLCAFLPAAAPARADTTTVTVVITHPSDEAAYQSPASFRIFADPWSPAGISNVLFYADGILIGQATSSLYSARWSTTELGLHLLHAVANDMAGASATSSVVHVTVVAPDTTPPAVAGQEPPAGATVTDLTAVAVTFSEPVAGVDARDLLVNGVPATGLGVSNATYTFTFPPPNGTRILIAWAADHGITDLASPANPFDAQGPGATWPYATPDRTPPAMARVEPAAGLRVRSLTRIAITFDEPVDGVTADDLHVNGQPALEVSGSGAGPYVFRCSGPAAGEVQIAWAAGQDIRDLAAPPNPFGGGAWTNVVDAALPFDVAVPHVIHISADGLGAVYLRNFFGRAPGQIPNFVRLKNEGASTLEARCDFFNSVTLPNHTCILTGRPVLQPPGWPVTAHHGITFDYDNGETLHNSGNLAVPYKASVLDVTHDHGLSTAFYASKSKFAFFVRSYDAAHGAADVTGADNGSNKIDRYLLTEASTNLFGASEALVTAIVNSLAGAPPSYIFLHFAELDYVGHYYNWGSASYSNALVHVDQQLGRLLAALDANPALAGRTAIVLTADHGGGGGTALYTHLDPTLYPNYSIPLFLWGPGFQPASDAYDLFSNRGDPGTNRVDYTATPQPLRNGDTGNIALALLGLPPVPGSHIVPAFGPPPVELGLQRRLAGFALSWPAKAGGYGLQTAPALYPRPAWQTITNGIETNGALKLFALPPPDGQPARFYRLFRP